MHPSKFLKILSNLTKELNLEKFSNYGDNTDVNFKLLSHLSWYQTHESSLCCMVNHLGEVHFACFLETVTMISELGTTCDIKFQINDADIVFSKITS